MFNTPGWDDQLLADIGDTQVSIENSVAVSGNTVYFSNGGGLVQGWDLTGFRDGRAPRRTFRFWTGDDMDASVVVDEQGFLYVGVGVGAPQRPGRRRGPDPEAGPPAPEPAGRVGHRRPGGRHRRRVGARRRCTGTS